VSDDRTFVIVGASLAGAKAAEQLRTDGFAGRIVLVGAETERPYERPPLSKGFLLGKDPLEKAYVHDADWYRANDVTLCLGVRATAIDPAAHTVALSAGAPLTYSKLLLATGSAPRRLNLGGGDANGIYYLRSMPDSTSLRAALVPGAQVVVIGAGWIGLEVAAAAREHGATVTVLEVDSLPLRRVLGDEVATIYADLHRAHGVEFRFGAGIKEFGTLDDRLSHVVLDDETELPADLAVVGVGIRPVVDLAEAAGLSVDNGIVTDERLTTSDPDIFAAGDVASYLHPMLGHRIRVEHWANARYGGRAAARSMLGQDAVYDRVPYFYSDQYDLGMEYAGYVAAGDYDRVVFRGETAMRGTKAPEFIAFWVKDDRVLAGMNANIWDVQDDIVALVKAGYSGQGVDLGRLADPAVPLADLLST
jgi:3-phenylpropionate/trans-cinnamate dioxygenase ferredoxin reductase subunit